MKKVNWKEYYKEKYLKIAKKDGAIIGKRIIVNHYGRNILVEGLVINHMDYYPAKDIKQDKDVVIFVFDDIPYFFDHKGFEKFLVEYWNSKGELGIMPYIVKAEGKRLIFFHRDYMKDEIEKFCREKNVKTSEVHVDHINQLHNDNRKCNLQVLLKSEHAKKHPERAKEWDK